MPTPRPPPVRGMRLRPEDALTSYARALAYQAHGQLARAIADYDRALELRPDWPVAYHDRGTAHDLRDDFDRARLTRRGVTASKG